MPERDGALSGGARASSGPVLRPLRLPAAAALLAAVFLAVAPADAAEPVAPRLRSLLGAARLVAAGQVTASTPYDDDRVAVVAFAAEKVLKQSAPGPAPAQLGIVELHEGPTRSPLTAGMRGIAFLRPAARTTYLAKTLPQGTYHELVPEYGAFVAASSPAELEREVDILSRLLLAARGEVMTPAQTRRLTFDLLRAESPVLVEDATPGLAGLDGATELSAEELETIRKTLGRSDLNERIRVGLIEAVGAAGLRQAIPVLQAIESPPPLAEAAWKALAQLGAPVPEERLEARIADRDPSVRAAAVREKLRRDGAAAVSQVAPVAIQDPDPTVRRAAVDALGQLGTPEALPPLERVFADSSGDLLQASARAILGIGGRPAIDAFGRLAYVGTPTSQRYAIVLLMTIDDPHKTEVLDRIKENPPDEQIRELLEHGLPVHDH